MLIKIGYSFWVSIKLHLRSLNPPLYLSSLCPKWPTPQEKTADNIFFNFSTTKDFFPNFRNCFSNSSYDKIISIFSTCSFDFRFFTNLNLFLKVCRLRLLKKLVWFFLIIFLGNGANKLYLFAPSIFKNFSLKSCLLFLSLKWLEW